MWTIITWKKTKFGNSKIIYPYTNYILEKKTPMYTEYENGLIEI